MNTHEESMKSSFYHSKEAKPFEVPDITVIDESNMTIEQKLLKQLSTLNSEPFKRIEDETKQSIINEHNKEADKLKQELESQILTKIEIAGDIKEDILII